MEHVAIVVIGAGIAGNIFAHTISEKYSVVVLDKKRLYGDESGFKKPCGGLIAPDAQRSLAKLGLSVPKHVLAEPQMFAVKTVDVPSNITSYYQRFYLNVHRHRLDCWLSTLKQPHVDLRDQCVVKDIKILDEVIEVQYHRDNQLHTLTTNYLVGADGAHSLVRKAISKQPIRQYVAIQESYELKRMTPHLGCFFDQHITDSYGWTNIKDHRLEFGIALPLPDANRQFEHIKQKMIKLGYPLTHPQSREACLVSSPKRLQEIVCGHNNVLLIGEAAGWISPSSLEGMSYAIDSAVLTSEAFLLSSNTVLKTYIKKSRKLKFKIFTKQLKSIVLYTPWIRRGVMRSQIQAIKPSRNG